MLPNARTLSRFAALFENGLSILLVELIFGYTAVCRRSFLSAALLDDGCALSIRAWMRIWPIQSVVNVYYATFATHVQQYNLQRNDKSISFSLYTGPFVDGCWTLLQIPFRKETLFEPSCHLVVTGLTPPQSKP